MAEKIKAATTVMLSIVLLALVGGALFPPHPAPTLTIDTNSHEGEIYVVGDGDGPAVVIYDGTEWKKISDLTNGELLAIFCSGYFSKESFCQ